MKTALLAAQGKIELAESQTPEIQSPDQVRVQVKAVGVCGSEVHAYEGTHPYRIAPVILGHETAGVIVEIGPEVTTFKVGDRILIDPQWTCGECDYCRRGMINLCTSKRVLGTRDWPGAFSETFITPQEAVYPLPEALSFEQGALIEPLTVAVHVARRAKVERGQSAAILGSGSIGGLVSGVCHAAGAEKIFVADIRQHPMDAARERLGATHDFLLPDVNFIKKTLELTGGEGVDASFVTADDVNLVNAAIAITRPGGKIVLVALLTEAPLQFMAYELIGKELDLLGSLMCTQEDVQSAIELAASGAVDVEGILTHRLPLSEAARGMHLAASKEDDAIKVIFTP